MAIKMTKKDYFSILRESYPADAANYDEVVAFIDHELELLAKKNSVERKPTAVQAANEGFKAAIVNFMTHGERYTIGDLAKNVPEVAEAELTSQRVSAIVRQLVLSGEVVRTEEKRKAYFALPDGE